jgi:hypothetical protein
LSCRGERDARPPLSAYPVVELISWCVVLSGATLTTCGLFICHIATVVGDGVVAISLGAAALIASTLVKGQTWGL